MAVEAEVIQVQECMEAEAEQEEWLMELLHPQEVEMVVLREQEQQVVQAEAVDKEVQEQPAKQIQQEVLLVTEEQVEQDNLEQMAVAEAEAEHPQTLVMAELLLQIGQMFHQEQAGGQGGAGRQFPSYPGVGTDNENATPGTGFFGGGAGGAGVSNTTPFGGPHRTLPQSGGGGHGGYNGAATAGTANTGGGGGGGHHGSDIGAGGSGFVGIRADQVFTGSSCWDLRVVFREQKAGDWA